MYVYFVLCFTVASKAPSETRDNNIMESNGKNVSFTVHLQQDINSLFQRTSSCVDVVCFIVLIWFYFPFSVLTEALCE